MSGFLLSNAFLCLITCWIVTNLEVSGLNRQELLIQEDEKFDERQRNRPLVNDYEKFMRRPTVGRFVKKLQKISTKPKESPAALKARRSYRKREETSDSEAAKTRQSVRREFRYDVSLDETRRFTLHWDSDFDMETVYFRLEAKVERSSVVAFGFSDYGESENADFAVLWTDRRGRQKFQVGQITGRSVPAYWFFFIMVSESWGRFRVPLFPLLSASLVSYLNIGSYGTINHNEKEFTKT